jgi:hypothetical protein
VITGHVFLYVGTGLGGGGGSYCFVLLCNVFPCLSNDFIMTFNLLLVSILLSFIRQYFFFINNKEFFS